MDLEKVAKNCPPAKPQVEAKATSLHSPTVSLLSSVTRKKSVEASTGVTVRQATSNCLASAERFAILILSFPRTDEITTVKAFRRAHFDNFRGGSRQATDLIAKPMVERIYFRADCKSRRFSISPHMVPRRKTKGKPMNGETTAPATIAGPKSYPLISRAMVGVAHPMSRQIVAMSRSFCIAKQQYHGFSWFAVVGADLSPAAETATAVAMTTGVAI